MLLALDFASETPIFMQVHNQVIMAISAGQLKEGDKLPTIRSLADQLGVNMMTISKAYQQLKAEGYIQTDRRSGAVVCGAEALGKTKTLDEEKLSALKLLAAQAKLAGISREAFEELCGKMYLEV